MISRKWVEDREAFLRNIKAWQALEVRAIGSAQEMISKTQNPLIRMTLELIAHDSEKHRIVQQMLIDCMTKEALHLTPEELGALSEGLYAHVEAEADALCFAEAALRETDLFAVKFLLSYLIDDEKKHHALLSRLDEFKRYQVESSASART